ncbi:uncharacterized protein LOC131604963 [Vicia villosa]|uniref:uncharacterized protein LOC131604963 n=1 Tax=Vicia villosa TaxID=3911 RepID=UPI00273CB0F4|nr:uncharacterized protein LOC131604963 [Vicia villosa]
MDFITHLPNSFGHTVIWVICDRLTKFFHFLALPTNFTAKDLASRFSVEIYRLHGNPKSIVSDRDPLFLSSFWKEFFKKQGTTLKYNTSYHPETDGQTEMTPFKALYGRDPPNILHYVTDDLHDDPLSVSLQQRDLVLLKLHPYRQQTVNKRTSQKLAKCFFGPFKIIKRVGEVAYMLDLPSSSQVHPVIDVSLLKPYHSLPPSEVSRLLPPEIQHRLYEETPYMQEGVNMGSDMKGKSEALGQDIEVNRSTEVKTGTRQREKKFSK